MKKRLIFSSLLIFLLLFAFRMFPIFSSKNAPVYAQSGSGGGSSSGGSSNGGSGNGNAPSPKCTGAFCSNAYLDISNPPNLYLVGVMGGSYPAASVEFCDASVYGTDACGWDLWHWAVPPVIVYYFPPANNGGGTASNFYWQNNDGTQEGCGAHGGFCRMPIPASAFRPAAGHAYVWQMGMGGTAWWCAGGGSCTGSPSCYGVISPDTPQLSSPSDNAAVVNTSPQTLHWNGISNWGVGCNPNNTYTVYFGDNTYNLSTVLCTVGSSTTSCTTGSLNPSTRYYWKVVANNGTTTSTSSTWSFLTTTSVYGWVYNGTYQSNRANVQSSSLIPNYTVNLSGTSNGTTTTSGTAITDLQANYLFSNLVNNSTYMVQVAVTPTGSVLSSFTNPQSAYVAGNPAVIDFPFVTITPTVAGPTPTPVGRPPEPTNTPTPTPNPLTPTMQPTPTPIKPTPSVCIPLPTPVLQLPAHQLCTNTKPTFSAYVSDPNGENVWAHFYSNAYETFDRLGSPVAPPYPTGTNSQFSADSYMLNSTGDYWWTAYTQNSATTCSKSTDAPAWLVTMDYVPPPKPTAPNCTLQSQSLLSGACTFNCSWPADPKVNPACADTNDYHPIFWTEPDNNGWDPGWIGNNLSTGVVTASDGQLLYTQLAARDSLGNTSSFSDTSGPFVCPKLNFSVTPTPLAGALDGSLISEWKLDEGSGSVAHDSKSNNDGTIYGASWTSGICLGSGLSFDGTNDLTGDDVTIANENNFDFDYNTPFSITAWVKSPGNDNYKTIVAKTMTNSPYSGYTFRLNPSNQLEFVLIKSNVGTQYAYVSAAGTDVSDNQWHHVAVTYNGNGHGSGVSLYLDGQAVTTSVAFDAIGSGPILNDEPLLIGRQNALSTYKPDPENYADFLGSIDEVRVYGTTLSASDITTLYYYESLCSGEPTATPTPSPSPSPTITPTPTPGDWIQVQGGDTYQKTYNYPVPLNQKFITSLSGDSNNRGVAWSGLSSWNFGFDNSAYKKVGTSLSNTYNFTYFEESLKTKSTPITPSCQPTCYVGTSTDLDNSHSIYSYSGLGYYTLDSTFWKNGMTPKTPVTIFLVSGSLEITKDFSFSPDAIDDTVVFVVNGNIYIDSGVNEIPGLYISSQVFSVALGQNTFTLDGMVYANSFSLNRIVRSPNFPTYTFKYKPQYMIALLPYLGRSQVDWQEVKP